MGDGCPGAGQESGPTPGLRVADGAGLAGGRKRPPCSPGARRRWPPRACALARPCAPCRRRDRKASAAIWWRRPGSCGAERGGRVRNTPIRGKTHPRSPTPLPPARLRFPQAEREWLASQERQCGAVVGAWTLMPAPDWSFGPPHRGPLLSGQRFLICKVGLKELRISRRLRIAFLADPCQAPDP